MNIQRAAGAAVVVNHARKMQTAAASKNRVANTNYSDVITDCPRSVTPIALLRTRTVRVQDYNRRLHPSRGIA